MGTYCSVLVNDDKTASGVDLYSEIKEVFFLKVPAS
jgi:hypothetical protein